jgi:hypothetical protein
MKSHPERDGFSVVAVRSEDSALRHYREESNSGDMFISSSQKK